MNNEIAVAQFEDVVVEELSNSASTAATLFTIGTAGCFTA